MTQYNSIALTEPMEKVDEDIEKLVIRLAETMKKVCVDSGHQVPTLEARLKAARFLFWNGLEED